MRGNRNAPEVFIAIFHPKYFLRSAILKRDVRDLLRFLKLRSSLEIVLTTDSEIRKVNRAYHAADCPTDVLAFASPTEMHTFTKKNKLLGEVIVSIDRCLVHTKRYQVTLNEEVFRCIVHGILHLMGERDDRVKERERMFRKQEALIDFYRPIPLYVRRK